MNPGRIFTLFHCCILSGLLLLLGACQPEPVPGNLAFQNIIRFDQPAVGQLSRYVRFLGEDISDMQNFRFRYLADTLEVRIIGLDSLGWIAEEQLTPFSESRLGSPDKIPWADSTFRNHFTVNVDSFNIIIIGNQYSFKSHFFRLPRQFSLQPIAHNPTRINGWKILEPYCECFLTAYADAYEHFGYLLPRLNVVIDNRAMAVDGPGYLHVYHPDFGFVKVTSYSWWTHAGEGWDLLP